MCSRKVLMAIFMTLMLLLMSLNGDILQAQQNTVQQASFDLPYSMAGIGDLTAYVPQQNSIYIFGGYTKEVGYSNKIVEISLDTEQVYVLNTTMPFSGVDLAVTYNSNDGKVYIFRYYDIYLFDPTSEALSHVSSNTLPESVGDYSTCKYIAKQDAIYVFGYRGSARGNFTLRYDIGSGNAQDLNSAALPSNNGGYSVAYCSPQDAAYLFGGNHSSNYYDLIQKFNLTSGIYTTLPLTLPTVSSAATAVHVPEENAIYIFGGSTNWNILDDVYKFNCGSQLIEQLPDLPTPLASQGVEYVLNQKRIYLLGGVNAQTWGYGPATDGIYYLQLNQPPDCSGAAIADQSADASCGAAISVADVTGVTEPEGDPLTITVSPTSLVLGANTVTVTANDGNGGVCSTDIIVNVVDTTPPDVTTAFIPVGDDGDDNNDDSGDDDDGDENQGRFAVQCSATDACDPNPSLNSAIEVPSATNPEIEFKVKNKKKLKIDLKKNKVIVEGPDPQAFWAEVQISGGISVIDGQEMKVEVKNGQKYEYKFDKMGNVNKIEAPEVTLRCTATDASGNVGSATASLVSEPGDDDEDLHKTIAEAADERSFPAGYALAQNFPNPFNPSTVISFSVPKASEVSLSIYNLQGQLIRTLYSGRISAGNHSLIWNGTDFRGTRVASGTYIYRLETKTLKISKKLALIR